MIVEKAYLELYPDSELGKYKFSIKYSGRFNRYNANVQRKGNDIQFNLSKEWKKINEDVKIGLIQSLFNRIFRTKVNTKNIDLYEIFIKKVHLAVPKSDIDPQLAESFDRVNEKYFYGILERPNLKWGQKSVRKLGSYEYGSDTIMISKIFVDSDQELLDYVMYHEMLHKKHKYHTKNGRSYHHTREFKQMEKKFEDSGMMEKKINQFVKKQKRSFLDFF
jgi:predicted SprT family Zn-dependent metalloprotease